MTDIPLDYIERYKWIVNCNDYYPSYLHKKFKVYSVYNPVSGKIYVGVTKRCLLTYRGSQKDPNINYLYGLDKFDAYTSTPKLLSNFDNKDDAFLFESLVIDAGFLLFLTNNNLTYNARVGGYSPFSTNFNGDSISKQRVLSGENEFMRRDDGSSLSSDRVDDETHHFLKRPDGTSFAKDLVNLGIHHWQCEPWNHYLSNNDVWYIAPVIEKVLPIYRKIKKTKLINISHIIEKLTNISASVDSYNTIINKLDNGWHPLCDNKWNMFIILCESPEIAKNNSLYYSMGEYELRNIINNAIMEITTERKKSPWECNRVKSNSELVNIWKHMGIIYTVWSKTKYEKLEIIENNLPIRLTLSRLKRYIKLFNTGWNPWNDPKWILYYNTVKRKNNEHE